MTVMTAITFDYNTKVIRTLLRAVVMAPINAVNAVYKAYIRSKAEAELVAMDDHLLADIGLSRGDIHDRVWGK